MNYLRIDTDDMLNGDGLRVVLWVAGCSHKCKGCQNKHTWNPKQGTEFTDKTLKEICRLIKKSHISGITFTGGDPLHKNNIKEITEISKYLREKFPNKTQWLYTGSTYEEVKELEIAKTIDILVDGVFEEKLHDNTLMWKGSSNQRVIDMNKSGEEAYIYCPNHKVKSVLKNEDYTHKN